MDKVKHYWNRFCEHIPSDDKMKKIWYLILLVTSTIYVCRHFDEVVTFTFFTKFNGLNLIFIVWLILLLLPFIDNFEGFGVKISKQKAEQEKKLDELEDKLSGKSENMKTREQLVAEVNQINEKNSNNE